MSEPLETFVRDNRQALDNAKPDPAIWEELSTYTVKPSNFILVTLWQKIKALFAR
jgi:hypothetical protein